jgi:hypothetical protein
MTPDERNEAIRAGAAAIGRACDPLGPMGQAIAGLDRAMRQLAAAGTLAAGALEAHREALAALAASPAGRKLRGLERYRARYRRRALVKGGAR